MKYIHIGETGVGSLSATGQLMESLFTRSGFVLLHDICNLRNEDNPNSLGLSSFKASSNLIDFTQIAKVMHQADADFVFIRLDHNTKFGHLEAVKSACKKPLVVSIMDDIGCDMHVQEALSLADGAWFISDSLKSKYKEYARQAHCFTAANGVDSHWIRQDNFACCDLSDFRIGFFGNLNPNQSLDALVYLSSIVKTLRAQKLNISVDIYSRRWKNKETIDSFRDYSEFTRLKPLVPLSQYRTRLQGYPVLFFGYGSSEQVVNYIRYSISNKLPEVLCSGLPSIGYGSVDCESLKLFEKYRPDYFVDACNSAKDSIMLDLIKSVYEDYFSHALKARCESRRLGKIFDIDAIADRFRQDLLTCCGQLND